MKEQKPLCFEKSKQLWQRLISKVPAGAHTMSHGPISYIGNAPKFLSRGRGCRVWDPDGNEYLDLAPGGYLNILGYGYEPVVKAVQRQIEDGTVFPMPHPLEAEVAEEVTKHIPCADMVRFCKNGSDATELSVRAARAYTGRDMVFSGGYHGFHDWYIGSTERNRGIPQVVKNLIQSFEYNNIDSLKVLFEKFGDQAAAVILEPVQLTPPKEDFLQKAKQLAHKHGAVFIFDEIITGFRWSMGGAQQYFGVTPDLGCFGKAMSNGFALAALTGKAEIMDVFNNNTFFSSTFGGETVGLSAAKATMAALRYEKVHDHIWNVGKQLKDGFNEAAEEIGVSEHVMCEGYPVWTVLKFKESEGLNSNQKMSFFQQECFERGLHGQLCHGMSFAHKDEDISEALDVYREALQSMKVHLDRGDLLQNIRGEPVGGKVFRKVG